METGNGIVQLSGVSSDGDRWSFRWSESEGRWSLKIWADADAYTTEPPDREFFSYLSPNTDAGMTEHMARLTIQNCLSRYRELHDGAGMVNSIIAQPNRGAVP